MKLSYRVPRLTLKAVWDCRRATTAALILLLALLGGGATAFAAGGGRHHVRQYRLDDELTKRSARFNPTSTTRVIVELAPGAKLPSQFKRFAIGRHLTTLNAEVLDLPNGLLNAIAANPTIFRVHYDRPTRAHNYRTSITVGARYVRQMLGYNGAGVGVAVIDSGIASWHDDLTAGATNTVQYPYGNQRVSAFVDFVNGRTQPYDDNGHGTHVAGTILGNGRDSLGAKAGMAPDASLISLKVLDANGQGTISNMIAALDWVVANHARYNIRVVNMSTGAGVYESYWTDPLTLAAKAVVDAGVVVVAAAGNFGTNAAGQPQYGGITAPGNAPWVLTVGASSTNGTFTRADDTMARFSSRGPSAVDYSAKPDLVAPGMGTVSLAAPGSTFYNTMPQFLQAGSVPTANLPYLVLSGTSMATPVVTGTVALMMQADPSLTPNAVKAILEYTAQVYGGYDPLTQGAGFLNSLGAVRLARFFATAQSGQTMPTEAMWGKRIIWGNYLLTGGFIRPSGSAWRPDTVWGGTHAANGDNIVWGSACPDSSCDNIVWGSDSGDNIVWGSDGSDNIVWGSDAGDNIVWGSDGSDNIVWGSDGSDNIVWGSNCGGADCDNIVWGSDSLDNIVWGSDAADNIVWGSDGSIADNIVWGSDAGDNIVWGSDDNDNIVWGSADADNIVWGSDDGDNIVWGSNDGDNIVWGSSLAAGATWMNPSNGFAWHGPGSSLFDRLTDEQIFGFSMFSMSPPVAPPSKSGTISGVSTTSATSTSTTTATGSTATSGSSIE